MLLNLHGFQIAAEMIGIGGPTVVFEAGAGMGKATWDPIWAEVASSATVFRYDRPGLGADGAPLPDGSAPAPTSPRTAGDVACHLHTLLSLAGAPGPYILVGHSFGGLVARLFAHRYPRDVAGVVLVDSSHPEQRSRSLAALPPFAAHEAPALTATRQRYLAPTDILPEGIDFGASLAEAGRAPRITGVPLVVVSRTVPVGEADLGLLRPGLPVDVARDLEQTWQALQRDLCTPGGHHLIAQRSGHAVHRDDPAVVVQAIRVVLSASAPGGTRPASSHRS
ncbi:MAG: putative hydrolase or acyltransferase of alpha/beta superfamily [Symbiobacteriaceae bacterium]|jgi:pimeloyl-ACP methyl ester carboxylesterase|nr:putative hydrolase or acyltransferase of alpha/beta superfamily [Symbiobacteriaceae bacterium]